MMPLVSAAWGAVAFVLCLVGFFFLVFANAREGRRLLRRPASRKERRICGEALVTGIRREKASGRLRW